MISININNNTGRLVNYFQKVEIAFFNTLFLVDNDFLLFCGAGDQTHGLPHAR